MKKIEKPEKGPKTMILTSVLLLVLIIGMFYRLTVNDPETEPKSGLNMIIQLMEMKNAEDTEE